MNIPDYNEPIIPNEWVEPIKAQRKYNFAITQDDELDFKTWKSAISMCKAVARFRRENNWQKYEMRLLQ